MPKETNINQDYVIKKRKKIGERIRFVRWEIMEISQDQLAEQVGVQTSTIIAIEQGKFDFKFDLLIKICIVLNLSIELI